MARVSIFVPFQASRPERFKALLRNARSKPTLCPTITAPPKNSSRVGRICSIFGALETIADVIPVKTVISGGIARPGSMRVWNTPSCSPPRYLTAPISVILSLSRRPPVVSKSSTQKVASWRGVPRSSSDCWNTYTNIANKRSIDENTDSG